MLPPKVFERVAAHLKAMGLERCPVCGKNDWETQAIVSAEVLDAVLTPFAYSAGVRLMRMGATVPLVLVSCTTCYNTLQFLWKPLDDTPEVK